MLTPVPRLVPLLLLLLLACTPDVPPPDGPLPDDGQPFAPVVELYDVDETSFEGFDVVQHLPDEPTGLAFLFHGTGGSSAIARKVEVVDVLNDLVDAGVGFVATESTDRDDLLKWDKDDVDPATNPDLGRLFRLRDALIDGGDIVETTPILGLGMSNGASFTAVFGHAAWRAGWPVRALSLHCGPVPAAVRQDGGLQVPTFFVVMENDTVVDNDNIRGHHDGLAQDGIDAAWHVGVETALDPLRFVRVPGIGEELSAEVFDRMVDAGIIDVEGVRLLSLLEADEALAQLELPAETDGLARDLRSQLLVVWAAHEFSAAFDEAEADFLTATRED